MLVGSPRQYHPVRSAMIHRAGAAGSGTTLSAQLHHHADKFHHHHVLPPPPSGLMAGTLAGYCGGTGSVDEGWFEPTTFRSTALTADISGQLYWDQTIKFVPSADDGTNITVPIPDLMATPNMSEQSWTRIQNNGEGVAVSL